ncbi:MAG: HicB family toxin-antitoxin system [Actinomycetota bacterium]|jgi:hypothetical protein|nr:HicB family toxin-antitoxin system [Actinomycetota bacterium]MDA2951288.1 HicB family toxin-antitoxin system [Actinomycetota bacterium]
MRNYKIEVYRDGRWWMIVVPELGQITQARRISEIEDMARSLIAVSTDAPMADVAVQVTSITLADGDDVLGSAQEIEQLRRQAQTLEAQAADAARAYALKLTNAGIPVRDAATLLHVSPQRISQLTNA